MKNKILRVAEIVFLMGCMFVFILAYILFEKTLMPLWVLFLAAFVGAAVTWRCLCRRWGWLVGNGSRWAVVVCHVLLTGLLSASFTVLVNYYVPSAGAVEYEEEVYVEKKSMTSHRKTRKVGKHRYVADGMRYEYSLDVVFADSTCKNLSVSRATYNRVRQGGNAVLRMRRGCLGFIVVDC